MNRHRLPAVSHILQLVSVSLSLSLPVCLSLYLCPSLSPCPSLCLCLCASLCLCRCLMSMSGVYSLIGGHNLDPQVGFMYTHLYERVLIQLAKIGLASKHDANRTHRVQQRMRHAEVGQGHEKCETIQHPVVHGCFHRAQPDPPCRL